MRSPPLNTKQRPGHASAFEALSWPARGGPQAAVRLASICREEYRRAHRGAGLLDVGVGAGLVGGFQLGNTGGTQVRSCSEDSMLGALDSMRCMWLHGANAKPLPRSLSSRL